MRHAVVVAPPRFVFSGAETLFAAPEPIGPLCAAFARGGQHVVLVPATPNLREDFALAVAAIGTEDDLVVYIAAPTSTRTASVTLRVGDETSAGGGPSLVQVRLLSDAVQQRQPLSVLFVVEACHDGDADDSMLAAEHAEMIVRGLDARSRGYGALIGVLPESRTAPATWSFTRHLLAVLDESASHEQGGATRISRVHDLLRAGGVMEAEVQSVAFVKGAVDSAIVELPLPRDTVSDPSGEVMSDVSFQELPEAPRSEACIESRSSAVVDDASRATADASGEYVAASSRDEAQIAVRALASSVAPIPDARPMQASLPAIEPLMALADDARERGALPEALAGYQAALMVAPSSDVQARASIYARIGALKIAQGRPREAELNFERALASDPTYPAALEALVELATGSKELRRAIDLRRKRLSGMTMPDERVAELRTIADIYANELQEEGEAAEALDQGLAVDGKSRAALEGLRVSYEKLNRWQRVVEVLSALAETAEEARERSALRFAAGGLALDRLHDEERAFGLLERALDDDPTHDEALATLIAARLSTRESGALEPVYARLFDRFVRVGDTDRAWETSLKLGALRRDDLHDPSGAAEAFAGAVRCKPDDIDSRFLVADMHIAAGAEAEAIAELERIAQYAPSQSNTYALLYGLHRRAARTDQAWLAASAFAEVGSVDMDQQLFVDQYRLDGPIRPSRSLGPAAWDELLLAPGADDVVTDVLRAIVSTAAATRIEDLRQARALVALDPARHQSAASTVSAVRSFQWAAQVLGVDPPELYVMDSVPGGMAAVHAPKPTTALGPDVLRGLTAKDLAFLAGRHLTYYKPEYYSLICYPTLNDLSVLFLGAVKVILPDLDAPAALRDAVLRTSHLLGQRASEEERHRLRMAVERLAARGGRADLAAWIRSVELSAQRAGLLLCGDIAVGIARLRAEVGTRAIAELSFEDKRGDMLSFCVSERLARARALLGVDAHTSVSVPPPGELQAS